MTIEIEHIDTWKMVRGILGVISNTISAETFDELQVLIRKMDEADLKTDSNGYIIKEDK